MAGPEFGAGELPLAGVIGWWSGIVAMRLESQPVSVCMESMGF